ncbi:MAG: 50S ribosomal protein L15 [Candidatus Bathyarchaeota archaeon]|nr:50S ribosomal protein L15 [Candidatus Bathyarchaeota archaeon]MCX8176889.1 50S ribosomal protein L15 [Candidatus Bathyarchaeota archaeon]MDW8193426.1 uL15 family ribosomal protein [Nitrososphaerota archaeon]
MPHSLRKTRKKRGSRTCGYGRVGQHRKSGSKGYRRAGRHKHGWTYVITQEPEYFGKEGFTSPHSLKRKDKVINVGELDELSDKLQLKGEIPVLDLDSLGYTKLLGKGKIVKPVTVKIAACSRSAAEKIREAGGQVIVASEETEE